MPTNEYDGEWIKRIDAMACAVCDLEAIMHARGNAVVVVLRAQQYPIAPGVVIAGIIVELDLLPDGPTVEWPVGAYAWSERWECADDCRALAERLGCTGRVHLDGRGWVDVVVGGKATMEVIRPDASGG
jgi:hypothetical protein